MKAFYLNEIQKLECREIDKPVIKPDEVLVKVMHVGVCGSDVHYYENGRIGDYVVKEPLILGHECAGEIVETGAEVRHLKIGDRVALEPGVPCGKCKYCLEGRYNLCPDVVFMATPPVHGSFVEYIAHPAYMCFKLPEQMDTVEGALIEPLSVAFQAVGSAGVVPGKSALVYGLGCIGLTIILALKNAGVHKIFGVDPIAIKSERARELGAVILDVHSDVAKEVKALTNGFGPDYVFDASGSPAAVAATADAVARGGTVVMVGLSAKDAIPYHFNKLIDKEATIKTVFRYANRYADAIEAVANGSIDVKRVVSDYYSFDQIPKAFAKSLSDRENIIKIVIHMQ